MKIRNDIAISLALGVTLAILDCFADAFVFHGRSLADQFLRPTPVEIWMRSVLIAACLALGIHFQRMAGKREVFEVALKRSHDELEQRVHERTVALREGNRRLEEKVDERAVRDPDPFGLPRRTGGVNDVGRVPGLGAGDFLRLRGMNRRGKAGILFGVVQE